MTIERAAATANDILDQTTDTLIIGMTLTPAAGDYLLFFTSEIFTAPTSDVQTTTFSIFVGGVQIDHSEREYKDEASLDNDTTTMVVSCKVSPNGSQAVEVRYRITANTAPLTAQRRELNLFPISGTDFQQTALTDDTRASATFLTLDSMTVTPTAGDYLLVFSTSGDGPADASLDFRVAVGGVVVDHSLRTTFQNSSIAPSEVPIYLAVSISPDGSQVVEIEWARVTGTGTITVHERTMNLIPTAAADIFQASGTVDDTDSTTTDKQVDDMLITNPGAADYLVIFSGTDFYGVIGNNVAETVYSIREGGVKVTDSDRMNEHEGSLDSTDLICGAGGRVTVTAGNDLQIFWQNANTDTRTIRERTMVALREAAGAVILTPAPVSAAFASPIPTLSIGPVTLTPISVSATWGSPTPTMTFTISGVTRDVNLAALGNVRVFLLKHNGAVEASRIYAVQAHINSDGSGNYSFTGLLDQDARYCVVAINQGAPIVRDATDDDLQP